MKNYLTLKIIPILCLFISCNQKNVKVERVNIIPKTIIDSLYIQRAFNFLCLNDHIYVSDVRQTSGFIKIYNSDGVLCSEIGEIGNGPEEFTTPICIPYKDESILIWNKYGRYNSAIIENIGDKTILNFTTMPINENVEYLQTDINGNLVIYDPSKENIITLYSKDGKEIASAGKLPYPQNISNKKDIYSGKIAYNPYNKKLLLTLNKLPYAAVYTINNNKITFLKEKQLEEDEYVVNNNEINIKYPGKGSMTEYCLTYDYIVSIYNDPDYTGSDHSQTSPGRNTVGVYDYNLNLIKIANINMPRQKLASQGKNNSFYSIVLNPEYSIVKVDL